MSRTADDDRAALSGTASTGRTAAARPAATPPPAGTGQVDFSSASNSGLLVAVMAI